MANSAPAPASFIRGEDVAITSAQVGHTGAVLNTGDSGTPVDNIQVEIPAKALMQPATVSLSYNKGTLSLPKGESSGAFLQLTAPLIHEFRQPVTILVRYDTSRHPGVVLVGYAIDAKGRLQAVTPGAQDNKAGTAIFVTFVPLLFTWVYVTP